MLKKVGGELMRISQISKFKYQNYNRLALNLKEAITLLFQRIFPVVFALPPIIYTKAEIQACSYEGKRSDSLLGYKPLDQNKCQRNVKNQTGFTFIEVAVTGSIMIILMAAVWSASSMRESDFSVMINQERLRLLTTRAKSLTVNSVFRGDDPACGYGIRVQEREAFIFLDRGACNRGNNRRFDHGEQISGLVNSITATGGVVFLPRIMGNHLATVDIVFIPPYSETVINGASAIEEVSIETRSHLGISRRVIINNQGLINASN